MQTIVQRTVKVREAMLAKPVWLLALAFMVWGVNALALQSVEFEHRGTIAISLHRISALQEIAEKKGKGTPYRFLECKLCTDDATDKHSDMRTVKLRVRANRHEFLGALEDYLLQATHPKEESEQCKVIGRNLRSEEWSLFSMQHVQQGIQRDTFRLAHAAANPISGQDSSTGGSAFKMVGFRKEDTSDSSELGFTVEPDAAASQRLDAVRSSLESHCQTCESRIATLKSDLANTRAASIGYLSFTGAQRQYPVVQPIGWARLSVAVMVGLSCWGLIAIAITQLSVASWSPIVSLYDRLRKGTNKGDGLQGSGTARASSKNSNSKRSKGTKAIDLGIPCLGKIEFSETEMAIIKSLLPETETSLQPPTDELANPSKVEPSNERRNRWTSGWNSNQWGRSPFHICMLWVQNASTAALVIWGMTFAVRLLADSAWRELFLSAPLAALTYILAGVP